MASGPRPTGPIRRAWYQWKALRLPWRRRFLIGLDLKGNTFWEFRSSLSADPNRMRRIVQYPPSSTLHYSDLAAQISPAWHQWLRHTRAEPPSLTEQSQDVLRQEQLKVLARRADERWAAKKSYLDAPGRERGLPLPGVGSAVDAVYSGEAVQREKSGGREDGAAEIEGEVEPKVWEDVKVMKDTVEPRKLETQSPDGKRHPFMQGERTQEPPQEKKEDPWKRARGIPGEEWQPQAWDPNLLAGRR